MNLKVGEIIGRFERKSYTIKGLKMFQCPKELAEEHYGDLSEKPFFPDLVRCRLLPKEISLAALDLISHALLCLSYRVDISALVQLAASA